MPNGDEGFWFDLDANDDDVFNFYVYWYRMRSGRCNDGSATPGCAGDQGSTYYYGNVFRPPEQTPTEKSQEIALWAARAGLEKKAGAIEIVDVMGKVDYADYLVLMTGNSDRHVAAIAPLNDVTARDLQKTDGQWARAKGFDTFCPVGPLAPATGVDWTTLEVACAVNGERRQHGFARDMAFGIPYLVRYISGIFTLEPGDVIATGTPEGVGRLAAGDMVTVEVRSGDRVLSTVSNPVRDS